MHLATVMYRNPVEEWLWESGVAYWLILGAIALTILIFTCVYVSEAIKKWRLRRKR